MKVKMSDKGGLSIDRMAHTLMEFSPTANTCGSTVKDGYIAFYHEDRLYSVRHIKSDAVILVYANNPYAAIEKCKMLGDIENFHVPFDVDKVIAELEELKTYKLDLTDTMTEIMARGKSGTYICLEDVIELLKNNFSDTAEPPKTD